MKNLNVRRLRLYYRFKVHNNIKIIKKINKYKETKSSNGTNPYTK